MAKMEDDQSHPVLKSLSEEYVAANDSGVQKKLLQEIAESICSRKRDGVLQIVEALQPSLTNTDIQVRRKGTQLLAELVHR